MKDWNIKQIEALTENEAHAIALETMQIKTHTVYFVDFGGWFGYSALVFMDGRHIYYANDYLCHYNHMEWSQPELRAHYIEVLNGKLFTEDEITSPITTYGEYEHKSYFLHNYYGMRREYVSIFAVNPSEDERKSFQERTASMTYDPVAFAYYDDAAFVEHHIALNDALESSWQEHRNDYEVLKSAFMHEMWNHEYAINWQGNWDVLNALYPCRYHDPDWVVEAYFEELNFNDTQRRAYMDARQEYMKQANDAC